MRILYFLALTVILTVQFGQVLAQNSNKNDSVLAKAYKSCPATCLLNKKHGACIGFFRKWYFNSNNGKCETFLFGGCRGNANRFDSKRKCMEKCRACRDQDLNQLTASDHPTCDCEYKEKGCRISAAPPEGFKCRCTPAYSYRHVQWKCSGEALKCDTSENCPANCVSRECCEKGSAGELSPWSINCRGYFSLRIPKFSQWFHNAEHHHERDMLVRTAEELKEIFTKNDIVPDVIDEAPKNVLHLEWKSGVVTNFADELTPKQVAHEPNVHWEAEANKFYLLAMVDPDEFNRENHTEREFDHWLVGNIPGDEIKKGQVLTEYVSSGPPQDGGIHRYVFLLFEQPRKLAFDEPKLKFPSPTGVKDRVKFSIRNLAKKYKLGNPVAGNFYFAQWDDSVPALLEKLGVAE